MNELTYTLTFDGAVLSAGLATHDAGLDAAHQRNAWNQQVLPARHMRGRVREALEEIVASYLHGRLDQTDAADAAFEAVARLFGSGDATRSGRSRRDGEPQRDVRSVIAFNDAVAVSQADTRASSSRSRSSTFEILTEEHIRGVEEPDAPGLEVRHRIVVNRYTGAVLPSHLGMAEAGRAGKLQSFRGTVEVPDEGALGLSRGELLSVLGWAFRWLECVGRTTQSGWGRIQKRELYPEPDGELQVFLEKLVQASSPVCTLPPARTEYTPNTRAKFANVGFAIVLEAPLVIGDRSPMANVVESRLDVPGSVLRRAMADVLLQAAGRRPGGWMGDSLSKHLTDPGDKSVADRFDEIEASFAHWAPPNGERIIPRPPTVTNRGDDLLREHMDASAGDIIALDRIVLERENKTLRFEPDTEPPRELRTHVTKSRSSGGGSDGNLFSVRAISPRCRVRETKTVQHTRLDGRVRCPPELVDGVRSVLGRVRSLGKSTRQGYGAVRLYEVRLPVDSWRERLAHWNGQPSDGVEVPVLLVTEALLLNPRNLKLGDDLTPAYRDLFATLIPTLSDLAIRYCSVRHRLYGGATARGIGATPPAVLTKAGSMWVLHFPFPTSIEQVCDAMTLLVDRGLENRAALDEVEQRWQRMVPTTAANGYGEICIAHKAHFRGQAP